MPLPLTPSIKKPDHLIIQGDPAIFSDPRLSVPAFRQVWHFHGQKQKRLRWIVFENPSEAFICAFQGPFFMELSHSRGRKRISTFIAGDSSRIYPRPMFTIDCPSTDERPENESTASMLIPQGALLYIPSFLIEQGISIYFFISGRRKCTLFL
jgi:hypothetical protein